VNHRHICLARTDGDGNLCLAVEHTLGDLHGEDQRGPQKKYTGPVDLPFWPFSPSRRFKELSCLRKKEVWLSWLMMNTGYPPEQ